MLLTSSWALDSTMEVVQQTSCTGNNTFLIYQTLHKGLNHQSANRRKLYFPKQLEGLGGGGAGEATRRRARARQVEWGWEREIRALAVARRQGRAGDFILGQRASGFSMSTYYLQYLYYLLVYNLEIEHVSILKQLILGQPANLKKICKIITKTKQGQCIE